jgi:hypothetical protein
VTAALAMLVAGVGRALLLPQDLSFDREYHLFFADHYLRDWFEPWDARWYGGFLVYTYPPLLHQLIALGGRLVGLDRAADLLQVLGLVGLPVAMWLLARELAGRTVAGWAAVLTLGVPGIFHFLYTFGQLPSLLALGLMWTAGACLLHYVRLGQVSALLGWAGCAGATAAAHHQTGLVGLPILSLTLLGCAGVNCWVASDRPCAGQHTALAYWHGRDWAPRAALALAAGGCACALVLLPHVWWILTQSLPQAEIPHPSRFQGPVGWHTLYLFIIGIWGGLLPVLLWSIPAVRYRPRLWPWMLMILLFATLGLGLATPLPYLLFPGWWHWLTYERFALWAAFAAVVPVAVWLSSATRRSTAVGVVLLLLTFSVIAATYSWLVFDWPPEMTPAATRELAQWLGDDGRADWYYLTVGLGMRQVARLSRLTRSTTIDGVYHTARTDPFLRSSGVGALDEVLWFPDRPEVLAQVLGAPDWFGVRWVVSINPQGNTLLEAAGWTMVHRLEGAAFATRPGASRDPVAVVIWQPSAADRVPLKAAFHRQPPAVPPGFAALWGFAPLVYLAVGLAAVSLMEFGSMVSSLGNGPRRIPQPVDNNRKNPPVDRGRERTVDTGL